MALVINKIQIEAETEDDDDYGSYFLQPASSPYNIAEKVQQANIDLFSNPYTMQRTSKVKFKDELTSFEPELTDDDVISIESDVEEVQELEYKTSKNVLKLNMFDINEEVEEDVEVVEEIEVIEPEVIEVKCKVPHEIHPLELPIISLPPSGPEASSSACVSPKRPRSKRNNTTPIDCQKHCIEKLDFDLSMSIKKLEIHEKPNCPILKLSKRKCCDENKVKNAVSLPCYNGLRSEYGLSSAALEKRERHKEIMKLKEQKRQQLMHEYKNRKNQQNEAVFCQWLKDISKRRAQKREKYQCKLAANDKLCSPTVINFPMPMGKEQNKTRERPKTANEFVPKQGIKRAKRPHTSPACVFIEVPPKLLERGINIGDLLVSKSDYISKKMHIVTIS